MDNEYNTFTNKNQAYATKRSVKFRYGYNLGVTIYHVVIRFSVLTAFQIFSLNWNNYSQDIQGNHEAATHLDETFNALLDVECIR